MHKLVEKIFGWSYHFFKKWDLGETLSAYLSLAINIIVLGILSYLIYLVFRALLVRTMIIIARKTKTKFDDLLVSNKTAKYIAHLIPFLFIYKCVPIILENFVYWESVFGKLVGIYIVLLSLWIIKTILHAFRDHLKYNPSFSDKPIDSYIQVIMITLWIFGFVIIVSKIFDNNQWE
jgi:miniconductance mechanosensitive channel